MSGVPQNPPRGCIRVSVVIPCYNGERYLADTIRSVMRQEVGPTETIVVDDGSTDGSREVVAAFGAQVRYARQPHGGAARARNLGAALATGTLLAFIDADDLWTEHALGALIAPLERDPSLSMTVGLMEQFVSPDLPDGARAVVLTASNRAAAGVYEDTSGQLLADGLRELGLAVDGPHVHPDDAGRLEQAMRFWPLLLTFGAFAADLRIGIIGTDTSHATAFTRTRISPLTGGSSNWQDPGFWFPVWRFESSSPSHLATPSPAHYDRAHQREAR